MPICVDIMQILHNMGHPMRLEWLEDLVAILESGSMSEAAKRRFVTQPAFSRRIRAIEDYIGAELFDRDRKPIGLRAPLSAHQDDIKRIVAQTRDLVYELRRQSRESHNRIVIVSQHAITVTLAARIVQTLTSELDLSVRLISANREECRTLLVTKQADLLLGYYSATETPGQGESFIESQIIGAEALIPVFAASQMDQLAEKLAAGELPVVAYPSDAFLGWIFNNEILPRMAERDLVRRKVETALTHAALALAINGLGVAWVPERLAAGALAAGQIRALQDQYPSTTMKLVAQRLSGSHSRVEDYLWQDVLQRHIPR
jgi:DNA-binding transcriptional LysR family regulator